MAVVMETDEKEEEEEEMIKLGNLSNDLVESIFSRIPLKSLVQLKAVSKTWRNSITNIRHCYPPTTSTGLVIFLKHKSSQESIFIKLHDLIQNQFCTLHSSHTHNFPYLIDSCNGVLLYASRNNEFWTYSVSSPVLDQLISLPISHHVSKPACSSLVFNGCNEFQIICFFWEEIDLNLDSQLMNCMIFSSETWNWRETQMKILNSELLLQDEFIKGECFNPSVFTGEKLYWIWSLCLLVHDINGEFFTLFPLPKNHSRKSRKGVYSQLIYESEGLIKLCDPVNNGFFIWTFKGNEFNSASVWKFDHFIKLEYKLNMKMGYSIKPCAFNKDLQVLYLHFLPHTIVAYSFETQKLVEVWSYCCQDKRGEGEGEAEAEAEEEKCWIIKIHPFLFSSVDLLAFNKRN